MPLHIVRVLQEGGLSVRECCWLHRSGGGYCAFRLTTLAHRAGLQVVLVWEAEYGAAAFGIGGSCLHA